jgi:UDP-4-amino-4,6-dideoxy-N-acetyl-beta-L-altrosamine transaminase
MIPYGKQEITRSDIDAVVKVLNSDFLTQGPVVPQFEQIVAEYCNVEHTVAVNSATSALHIACLALGLGKGDYLWTSPNTFVASANCGLYCGAKIDFIDIDHNTYNVSSQVLEEKLVRAEKNGKLPKIVIPVHFAGQACEMEKIHQLSKKYGFKIIEDASHAIGGKYQNRQIGSCLYSDITIFSFHPVKIITTGEGGMASTNSPVLAEKMRLLRSHGVTRNAKLMTKRSEGAWYYQQIDLGFNYRMTDIQAALGISQMRRIDQFIKHRHEIQQRYDKQLAQLPVVTPFQVKEAYSALHLYPIQINYDVISKTRNQVFDEMRKSNIGVNVHYIPVHTQPYYQSLGFKQGDFPNAENYYSRAMSLPIFSSMTSSQQDDVVSALHKVLM